MRGDASAGEGRNEKAGWDHQPAYSRSGCAQKFQAPEVVGKVVGATGLTGVAVTGAASVPGRAL